jgi:DNA polymerase-3 subunit epsilon
MKKIHSKYYSIDPDKLTEQQARDELDELAELLAYHDRLYEDAEPEITDAVYDVLRIRNSEIENFFPHIVRPDSPSNKVGAPSSEKFQKIKHEIPMLSLRNAFSYEDAASEPIRMINREIRMKFIAIDFETANPDLSSICQIGTVTFEDGKASEKWQTLINPEDFFYPSNISIHGIDEKMVQNAPTFPQIFDTLCNLLSGQVVVCHTHFDRAALSRVVDKYQLSQINCTWLDTAKVARRAWKQFTQRGYGLKNIAEMLGIEFQHHNAEEDAWAAGEILLRAISETGLNLEDWLIRVKGPICSKTTEKMDRNVDPEGQLSGEVMVFTGALSIPRREAADLAVKFGCEVANSVNKNTTILVVGDQDINRLAGHKKSSKHRKTEDFISKGKAIKILKESDFFMLIEDFTEQNN